MKYRCVVLFLAFLLHGCESGQEPLLSNVDTGAETFAGTPAAMAVENLSERLGVPPGEVRLISEKSVTWPDGSLGCPKEGMMYTQAMVAGGLIVLQVDGQVYEYHFADGREPFLCDRPGEPARKDSLD